MTLRARLEAAVRGPAPDRLAGDEAVDGGDRLPRPAALIPAAVLVGVVDRPEPTLLLTQRTANLRAHPGQIAFPGGRIDPDDADAVAAALREAWEEVGLPPGAADVVGSLGAYRTVTGYHVEQIAAVLPPDLPLRPREAEVADLFEAPLAHLLDPANQRLVEVDWQGARRRYWEIEWRGRRIWGATAAMIVGLGRRMNAPVPA